MSTPAQTPAPPSHKSHLWEHLPTVPEALASLMRTVVVALFLLTFVLQPFLIPSESMERTLLVGDFLLVNKQIFAPSGNPTACPTCSCPIATCSAATSSSSIIPIPRSSSSASSAFLATTSASRTAESAVNGVPLNEPYVAFEPVASKPVRRKLSHQHLHRPQRRSDLVARAADPHPNGELVVPAGQYFMLGDNRNHSKDSRFWGFVPREAIIARPLVIYFSLRRPSTTDVQQAADDRLGHDRELSARLAAFARWKRIFRVVH